jgi:predicted AAA+ superfamily ATPase
MINRTYKKQIETAFKAFPAVALLGPRQIGKSTLAKLFAGTKKKKMLYLDLEKASDRKKLEDAHQFLMHHKDYLIIIDEIQIMPHLFADLRPIIDEYRINGRFLLLGSASPALVRGVSESLAGRISYIELPSVTLPEAIASKIDQEKLWLNGGFPASLQYKKNADSLYWRQQLIRSFIERDLRMLFNIDLSYKIADNFWQMLAHINGNIWNASTIATSLGITSPTVKRYLEFLEAAFMVRVLDAWFINAEKRINKAPKVFFRDSGLLHAFLNIDSMNDLHGHPVAGGSWEGFVIEQIIQQLPYGIKPYYYRTSQNAEADLVLVKGIKPIVAIEIKLSNSPSVSRGFYESLRDLKLEKGFVVTPQSDTYALNTEAMVMNLSNFLKKLPSLLK